MLSRVVEGNNKSKLFGKNTENSQYSEAVDLWSIGCTLVYIACNCDAFAAQTADALIEIYTERGDDAIMGSKRGEVIKYSTSFREQSPINKTASPTLKNCYLEIIKECFKKLEIRSIDKYFRIVQELQDIGLCYTIDINTGNGRYGIPLDQKKDDTSYKSELCIFSLKSVEHYCQALKFDIPVRFSLNKSSEIRMEKPQLNIVSAKLIDTDIKVIRSQCEAIQSIIALVERPDLDINMLRHLCTIIAEGDKYELVHKLSDEYSEKIDKIFHKFDEIKQIYKDMAHTKRTIELNSLKNRCTRISKEFKEKEYISFVYGKGDHPGLLSALCDAAHSAELQRVKNIIYY